MNAAPVRLRHALTDHGVSITLHRGGEALAVASVADGEAKRFAWALLADLDPGDIDVEQRSTLMEAASRRAQDASSSERALQEAFRLARTPAAILLALFCAPGFLTKPQIMKAVYGGDPSPTPKIIDVYVCRLRALLSPEAIRTDRYHGYCLTDIGRNLVAPVLARTAA